MLNGQPRPSKEAIALAEQVLSDLTTLRMHFQREIDSEILMHVDDARELGASGKDHLWSKPITISPFVRRGHPVVVPVLKSDVPQ